MIRSESPAPWIVGAVVIAAMFLYFEHALGWLPATAALIIVAGLIWGVSGLSRVDGQGRRLEPNRNGRG